MRYFKKGLRLPVVKFLERGVPNQALWDVITLNVRTPEKVLGDLQAQIAACKSCEKELGDLFDRYGVETVLVICRSFTGLCRRTYKVRNP